MANSSQKLVDKGWNRIQRDAAQLSRLYVDVGIQSDAGADNDGEPIIDRAFSNEFGKGRIPERSFIRSAFDEQQAKLNVLKNRLLNGVIDGKLSPERAAGLLGQQHEKDIKDKIRSITTPPLSKVTIARKKSSKPLIDTGQMLNSVRYVVGGE